MGYFLLYFVSLIFISCSNNEIEVSKQNAEDKKEQDFSTTTSPPKIEKKKIAIWQDSPKMPSIPFVIKGCQSEYGCTISKNEVLQEITLFQTPDLEGTAVQTLRKGSTIVSVSYFLLIDTLPACKLIRGEPKTIKFVHLGGEGAEYFWDGKKFIDGHDLFGEIYDCKKQKLPARKTIVEVEYSSGKFGWTDQTEAFEWFYP